MQEFSILHSQSTTSPIIDNQLCLRCSASGPTDVQIDIFWCRVLNATTNSTPELLSNDAEGVLIYPKLLNGRPPTTYSLLLLTNVSSICECLYFLATTKSGDNFSPTRSLYLLSSMSKTSLHSYSVMC